MGVAGAVAAHEMVLVQMLVAAPDAAHQVHALRLIDTLLFEARVEAAVRVFRVGGAKQGEEKKEEATDRPTSGLRLAREHGSGLRKEESKTGK